MHFIYEFQRVRSRLSRQRFSRSRAPLKKLAESNYISAFCLCARSEVFRRCQSSEFQEKNVLYFCEYTNAGLRLCRFSNNPLHHPYRILLDFLRSCFEVNAREVKIHLCSSGKYIHHRRYGFRLCLQRIHEELCLPLNFMTEQEINRELSTLLAPTSDLSSSISAFPDWKIDHF